jgi:hypothetical protein
LNIFVSRRLSRNSKRLTTDDYFQIKSNLRVSRIISGKSDHQATEIPDPKKLPATPPLDGQGTL